MDSKLRKEITLLVKEKVISAEVGEKITAYYQSQSSGKTNRLMLLFGVFGALLIGSGILLMLAHNWDQLSKMIKTIIAFVPLLIGQLAVGFSLVKNKSRAWRESSGTFLFFAVGISMSLISQIYHIEGELSGFLLTWILLCLPLIYILKSHAVTLLILCISTFYAFDIGWEKPFKNSWTYIVIFLAIMPHYIQTAIQQTKSNIMTIYNWAIPVIMSVVMISFVKRFEGNLVFMYIALFGVFYSIGTLWKSYSEQRTLRNGYLIIGSLGTVITFMILSFEEVWKDISHFKGDEMADMIMSWGLFAVGIALVVFIAYKKKINLFHLASLSYVVLQVFPSSIALLLLNLFVLALGINAIWLGVQKMNFGILNYGMLIIAVLISCRFFDNEISFIVRGIVFILIGISFFIANYKMSKLKK